VHAAACIGNMDSSRTARPQEVHMEFTTPSGIPVAIAHLEPLIVAGVRYALQRDPALDIHFAEAHHTCQLGGVVITDPQHGVDLATQWRAAGPGAGRRGPRVMVVARQAREFEVRQALEAGVKGYLLASCQTDELPRCVRALHAGSSYLSTTVAQRMADSLARDALTSRELDVLRLLVRGDCNKRISQSLSIALGTVKAHVKSIMSKLDARSRTHAVAIAASRGLVQSSRDGDLTHPLLPQPMPPSLRVIDRIAA
jgi:DNA-binding NarL/FixJ family response regulator